MIELTRQIADRIEGDPAVTTRGQAINRLRELGLTDFGLCLISMPDPRYPKLSRLLPAMASEEVQRNWTGNAGTGLLRQTSAFVRALSFNYGHITGRDIGDASILDFGCGYGRMLRLMWFFAPDSMVYGVDPWDQSVAECRKCGLTVNLAQSEYYESAKFGYARGGMPVAFVDRVRAYYDILLRTQPLFTPQLRSAAGTLGKNEKSSPVKNKVDSV